PTLCRSLRHRDGGGQFGAAGDRRGRRLARVPRPGAGPGPDAGARVGPVVARRAAVRGGRGLLAVPAGHPAEHAARDRRRGVAAAAPGGTAGAGRRGPVAEGSRRAVAGRAGGGGPRSEEHTSELQSRENLVCRLLLEKKNAWRKRKYSTT